MRLQTSKLKRAVALVAASCTLGTCCIAGSIAWAGNPTATVEGANTANIKKQDTSITIYKYEGPESQTRNDGKEHTIPDTQKPIEGVRFKITRVMKNDDSALDLSTAQAWKDIEGLIQDGKTATEELAAKNLKLSEKTTDKYKATTDRTGKAEFTGLGQNLSLYYVEEDLANSTPKKDSKPVKITKQVNPFLVTVPLPDTTTHGWIYKLKIYPKNDVSDSKVTKKAEADPSKPYIDGVNTTMGWDISIPLTAIKDGGNKYTNVSFTDPINTDFLNYKEVKDLKLVDKDGNNSVTLDAAYYEIEAYSTTGNNPTKVADLKKEGALKTVKWIRVKLTDTGLAKASAKVGGKLTATVVTSVIAPGAIKNLLNTDVDGVTTGEGNKNPCVPTKEKPCNEDPNHPHEGGDTTNFAKLTINKIGLSTNDAKNDGKPLKGATFKVYPAAKDKKVNDLEGKTVADAGTSLVTDNDKVREMAATGDDGVASDSFFVGNGADNTKVYCAVETVAPEGFNLDDKLHCFNLTSAKNSETNNTKTINNKQSTDLDKILAALPMTGARGLVILTVCGIVGIAGTLFYVVMKRRKEQEQE